MRAVEEAWVLSEGGIKTGHKADEDKAQGAWHNAQEKNREQTPSSILEHGPSGGISQDKKNLF